MSAIGAEMVGDTQDPTRFSLRRWSQRKLAAGRRDDSARRDEAPPGDAAHADDSGPAATAAEVPITAPIVPNAAIPLPSLESLTIDSDYSPFMQPGVDEDVKRSALRKLLRHPRFNVMDGLDVYIDDYSIPSPMEPALVRTLMQARYIFDPPKTRVNADGHVEDVPDAPAASADAAPMPPGGDEKLPDAAGAQVAPASAGLVK